MSFPGKVIENLWFASLSCLRTQVLVRVPNFLRIYLWKKGRTLRAGFEPAREVPIGVQDQRLNHSAITDLLTLFVFWWSLIPSLDFCMHYCSLFCWGLSWWSFPNAVAYMSFPGKVIENLWFASLSCLRTQVLVRVPNFLRIYLWKKGRTLRAGFEPAREVPIGVQDQRLNHSAITDLLTLFVFWWSLIPSLDFCMHYCSLFCWGLSCWSFPNAVAYMSFPGKVIENLWFASLSCLRTQVLVRVPNFLRIYLWKKGRTLRGGFETAREIPIGFLVQRLNHSAITALLTFFVFGWSFIPSVD